MKNKKKLFAGILSFGLATVLCFGVAAFYDGAEVTLAATDYYAPITASGGEELLGQVHDLITTTHKTYTSYNDCKSKGTVTDPGEGNNTVMEFYTHIDISSSKWDVSGGWNREHVWPKSDSNGLWGTDGGGSDLHHIRPAEKDLNNSRGNKLYGEVGSNGTEEYTSVSNVLGGYSSGNTFEPLDNVKGDVARIVMYVYSHYNNYANVHGTTNGSNGGGFFGKLNFTYIMSAGNEEAAQKMLLDWNKLDPVDEIETYRNDAVYQIQGNRNPFIDHPEYADAIWGDGSTTIDPDPDPDPSDTLKGLSISAARITLNIGGTHDLTVTPNPVNASASVNWTSSNTAIATVANGRVTAKAAGTATITATSTKNTAIKASATVTVLASSSSETETGKITITRASFPSASGSYAFQTWSAGSVEGIAYVYGGNKDDIQFNTSKSSQYLASTTPTGGAIKKVTISGSGNTSWTLLTSAQPFDELASGNPQNGTVHNKDTSSDSSWTVDGNDNYFALVLGGSGVAYLESIEVEYGSGGTGGTELKNLLISPSEFAMKKGESVDLTVLSVPSSASAEVTWSSSDPSVATVSANGRVTAIGTGSATITATSTGNSAIKANAEVTVTSGETDKTDETKIQAFRNAVSAIADGGSLGEWRNTINTAAAAYRTLSEADRAACTDEVAILREAIASYNEKIGAYNQSAQSAEHAALNGVIKGMGE